MVEFEAITAIYVYVKKYLFVSNQIRSLDHATLGFKLSGMMKKIN